MNQSCDKECIWKERFCDEFIEEAESFLNDCKCNPGNEPAFCQAILAGLKTLRNIGYTYGAGGVELWLPIGPKSDFANLDKLSYWRERCLLAEKQLGVS